MNQSYFLKVRYSGTLPLKFTVLLKENNKSSISIIDTTSIDNLDYGDISNYVLYTKPD